LSEPGFGVIYMIKGIYIISTIILIPKIPPNHGSDKKNNVIAYGRQIKVNKKKMRGRSL